MSLNVSLPITPNSLSSLAGGTTAATVSQSLSKTNQGCMSGSGLKSAKGLKPPKPKKCKVCRAEFTPTKPMQSVCTTACALSLVATKKAKAAISAKTAERKETKAKLEKLKTRGNYMKEAQVEFNKYIRLRDAGKGCISCGADCGATATGGSGDAGHFRSRGSAPHLRFDERNCHLQCKKCNRYLSGNVAAYRVGLIDRIGADAVEALECDQTSTNFSIDDLQKIKAAYRAKAKELEKAGA